MARKYVYADIEHDLKFYPQTRERKNKNRYIARKLEKKHHTGVPENVMAEIVAEVLSMDRGWRHVLQHNPKLRGTDYDDKKVLEQEKQVELEYQAGSDVNEFQDIIDAF